MIIYSRACPHPACGVAIPERKYACTQHWRVLPSRARDLLLEAYFHGGAFFDQVDKAVKDLWRARQ
jgi:hypothetical protein